MYSRHALPSKNLITLGVYLSLASMSHADTALETETGDLGKKGESNFSQGVQFEKATDGKTAFLLNQYEYGVTDRAEILIEPFFYEIGIPTEGKQYGGIGDLEITPSYMVILEGKWNPAVVTSFKIKVPTARNTDIGTGKFDYYPYLIFGKHIGKFDLNANLGVTFFGQPDDGPHLDNEFIYDLACQTLVAANSGQKIHHSGHWIQIGAKRRWPSVKSSTGGSNAQLLWGAAFRRDSPFRTMLMAPLNRRSQMASAKVGSANAV